MPPRGWCRCRPSSVLPNSARCSRRCRIRLGCACCESWARRRDRARLLVLGTYRPTELIVHEHPLKAMKQELAAHGQCVELPLGYLRPEDIEAYLAQRYGAPAAGTDLADFVYRRTEGHPLFMVQ